MPRKAQKVTTFTDMLTGDKEAEAATAVEQVRVAAASPALGQAAVAAEAIDREDLRRSMGGGRHYVWPPNDPAATTYMSVTTAIDSLPKPAIPRWAAKVVAEFAVDRIEMVAEMASVDPSGAVNWLKQRPWASRDKAAHAGTLIHRVVELDAIGTKEAAEEAARIEASLGEGESRKVAAARDFFATIKPVILRSESVVFNHTYGYAGTYDFMLRVDSPDIVDRWPGMTGPFTALTDLKTGKGVYPEVSLQLAAYAHAEYEVDFATVELVPMMAADAGAVLHVTEDGWTLTPALIDNDAMATFLRALMLAKVVPLDPSMLGTPVVRGRL